LPVRAERRLTKPRKGYVIQRMIRIYFTENVIINKGENSMKPISIALILAPWAIIGILCYIWTNFG